MTIRHPYFVILAVSMGCASTSDDKTTDNLAPVAAHIEYSTDQDTPLDIVLSADDPDGDSLTFLVVDPPANGELTGDAPDLTYTPDSSLSGMEVFTFVANDGTLESALGTVTINISSTGNQPPVANEITVVTDEDIAVPITLDGTDPEGALLTYAVVQPPTHGVLEGAGASLLYTPEPDVNGTDKFTYRVSDSTDVSVNALVTIEVQPVNDAPTTRDETYVVPVGTTVTTDLRFVDIDSDDLSFVLEEGPSHGTLVGIGSAQDYTPDAGFSGVDEFTFRVTDGELSSDISTVTLLIQAVNEAPVAQDRSVTAVEDEVTSFDVSATDAENDALTYLITQQPQHGQMVGPPPSLTYQSDPDWNGTDTFRFIASDATSDSNEALVTITVEPANDRPVADPLSLDLDEDTSIEVTLSGSDIDLDDLTPEIENNPGHGTLVQQSEWVWTYTPDADLSGNDSFSYRVFDGLIFSAPATVNLAVQPVNDVPVATPFAVVTNQDERVDMLLAATDADGDALTYLITNSPSHGALSGTPPNIRYIPNLGFVGTDTFRFAASDATTSSSPALVNVDVLAANTAPQIDSLTISPSTPSSTDTLSALAVVVDDDGDSFTVAYSWYVGSALVGDGTGTLTADQFAKDDIVYVTAVATDTPGSDSDVATSSTVTIGNASPQGGTAAIAPVTPTEGDDLVCLLGAYATDPDGDPISYSFAWEVNGVAYPDVADTASPLTGPVGTTTYDGDTVPGADVFEGDTWTCTMEPADADSEGSIVTTSSVVVSAAGVCGDGVTDAGEEFDPPPGPFTNIPINAECRWDFSAVGQLYCDGDCSVSGALGCDQDDADRLCRLTTNNPASVALSFDITTALDEPGFGCAALGLGQTIPTDRGVDGLVSVVDESLLADHGAGDVVSNAVCSP
jgi:hypothetical protein